MGPQPGLAEHPPQKAFRQGPQGTQLFLAAGPLKALHRPLGPQQHCINLRIVLLPPQGAVQGPQPPQGLGGTGGPQKHVSLLQAP